MNKFTFKEVKNGVPVFREVNPLGDKPEYFTIPNSEIHQTRWEDLMSEWLRVENSLSEYEAHPDEYLWFEAEHRLVGIDKYPAIFKIGDTVTADIHEGKLINLKLAD